MLAIATPNSPDALHPLETSFLRAIADGDPTARAVYADWLEERGSSLHAEYVRTQYELLTATNLEEIDERASHLAILSLGIDQAWRAQLECQAIRERRAERRLRWLAFGHTSRPKPGTWELPEQLRYLEKLTPRTPPEPIAMAPRRGGRWW